MLWLKALHIIFVVAWFAGLFYLPRLFVYHCDTHDEQGHARFCTMERRLYALMTVAMLGTWGFGIALLLAMPAYLDAGWMQVKLALVLLLTGFHGWLRRELRRFAARQNARSARSWRWINEAPTLFLVAIVILVVVRPF